MQGLKLGTEHLTPALASREPNTTSLSHGFHDGEKLGAGGGSEGLLVLHPSASVPVAPADSNLYTQILTAWGSLTKTWGRNPAKPLPCLQMLPSTARGRLNRKNKKWMELWAPISWISWRRAPGLWLQNMT